MNPIRKILEDLEFEPTEIPCNRCSGSGWVMDNHGEQVECEDCYATGKITEMKVKDIDSALASMAEIVEGMKLKEHSEFCGTRPEWRDRENNGQCDCSRPSYNKAISEVADLIRGEK